jgi:hypothetical protein
MPDNTFDDFAQNGLRSLVFEVQLQGICEVCAEKINETEHGGDR